MIKHTILLLVVLACTARGDLLSDAWAVWENAGVQFTTLTWISTSSTTTTPWSNPSNWNDTAPVLGGSPTYQIQINGSGTKASSNDFAETFLLNSIRLGVGGMTIYGNPLLFLYNDTSSPAITNSGNNASTLTINNNITISNTLDIYTDSAGIILNGILSGATNLVIKSDKICILNGANTYSGSTDLDIGTLGVGSTGALGRSTLVMASGTILSNTVDITTSSGITNNITLVGMPTITTTTNLTLSGKLTGDGFIKDGPGILRLTGASTYTSNTVISAGTLYIGSGGTIGSTFVTNNGTLVIGTTAAQAVTGVAGTGNIIKTNSGAGKLYAPLTYSGATAVDGGSLVFGYQNGSMGLAGELTGNYQTTIGDSTHGNTVITFSNVNNTFTGPFSVYSGTAGLFSLGDNPTNTISLGFGNNNATFKWLGGTATFARPIAINNTSSSGNMSYTLDNSGTGVLTMNGALSFVSTPAGTVVLRGTYTGGTNILAGSLTDTSTPNSFRLTKTDASIWALTGTNTYSGKTVLSQGTLTIGVLLGLSTNSPLYVTNTATMALYFTGTNDCYSLYTNNVLLPSGVYSSNSLPSYFVGGGYIKSKN